MIDAKRTNLESAVVVAMDRASRNVMQWGVDDCGLWFADIIRETLGYDPAKRFRGRYKTRRGAARALGSRGLLGAMRQTARRHDWQRIDPKWAKPGDVALAWTVAEAGKKRVPVLATMICRAPGWFVGRNDRGYTAVPADKVAIAWSVLPDYAPGPRASLPRVSSRPSMIATSAAMQEPVSTAITVTALLAGASATTAAVLGAIGGFVVSSAITESIFIARSRAQ